MKTEVILIQNIVGLGGESDHVKVAAGYARNYLYPQGLAIPLTAANKRRLDALKQRRGEREAHEFNTMSELSKSLSKLTAVVTVKTGEDGKMFGTVTAGMIADQLKHQFDVALDKRKIHLEHPIRTLGEHDVELRLHSEITTTLKLRVESSTPLPPPPETPAKEGRREDRATEKRGKRRETPEAEIAGDKTAKKPVREPKTERAPKAEHASKPKKTEKPEKTSKPE